MVHSLFLSTPSARRATHGPGDHHRGVGISIHALREEGDLLAKFFRGVHVISIHALREEGDREARSAALGPIISIHALREEGDQDQGHAVPLWVYFYPRPPRGGRLVRLFIPKAGHIISIHALREEGDPP